MTGNWRERIESKLRGQSEVLGVALLTAIVVILVATVALFIFGDFTSEANDEQLLATVESDVTSQNITITHQGGDSFEPENVSVVLRGDTSYEKTLSEFSDPAQNNESFSPGDTWTDGNLTLAGEFRLLVIDEESSTVLHDQTHEVKIQDVRLQVQDGPPGSGASYTTNDITMPGADSISTPNKIQRNYRVQVKYDDGLGWRNQTGGTDSMTTSSSTISVVSTNDKGGTIEASAPSGTEEEVDLSVTTDPSNPAVDDDIPSNVVTVTVTEPNFDVATAVDSISANAGPTESDNTVDIDWSADSNGDFAPSPTVKVSVTDKSGNVPITLGAGGSNSNCTNTGTGVAECDINFGGPKDNLSSGSGLPVIEADAQPSTEKISVDITPVSGGSYTSGASDSESFSPATFDLGITSAGLSGGVVSVDYTVDNTGDFTDTQDIALDIAGTDEDTNGSVTLTPSEGPDSGTLTASSIPPSVSNPVTVTVEGSGNSNDATDTVSVTPATFDISITSASINNQEVSVGYEVENTGDLAGTQDIILDIEGSQEDTDSGVSLDPGDSPVTGTLTSGTLSPPGDGQFDITVKGSGNSNDATDTVSVTPPTFDISITDTSISTGVVSADYTVENTGDFTGTQDIVLDVGSNTGEDTNSSVTLTPGEGPDSGTLTSSTLSPPGDGDFTVTVSGSGTSNDATDTLSVTPPQISVTVDSLSLNGNNKLAFGYTVSNGGGADFSAERDVSVSVNNSATVVADGVSSNPVTLLPGDSITNSGNTDKITSGGTYELTVSYGSASASATKKVNGPTFDLPNGQTEFIHDDNDGDGQLATKNWDSKDELVADYKVNDKSIPGTATLKLTVDGTVVNSTTVSSSDDTGTLRYDPQRGHLEPGNTSVDVGDRLEASEVALEVTGNTYQPNGNPSTIFGNDGLELYAPPLIESADGDEGRNKDVWRCDGGWIGKIGGFCGDLWEYRFDASYDYEIDDPGNDFKEIILNVTNTHRPRDRVADTDNWEGDKTLVTSSTSESGQLSVYENVDGYCPGFDTFGNPAGGLQACISFAEGYVSDNAAEFDVNFTVIDDSGRVSDDGENKNNPLPAPAPHNEEITPVDNANPSEDYRVINGENGELVDADINGESISVKQDIGTSYNGNNYNLDAVIEWDANVTSDIDRVAITPVDASNDIAFGLIDTDGRGPAHTVDSTQDWGNVTATDAVGGPKRDIVYDPETNEIDSLEDGRVEAEFLTDAGDAVTLNFRFINESGDVVDTLKVDDGDSIDQTSSEDVNKKVKWSGAVEQSSFTDYLIELDSIAYTDNVGGSTSYNDPKNGGDGTLDANGEIDIEASTVNSPDIVNVNPDDVAIRMVDASDRDGTIYTDWRVKEGAASDVLNGGKAFDLDEFTIPAYDIPNGLDDPYEDVSYWLAFGNNLDGGSTLDGEKIRLEDYTTGSGVEQIDGSVSVSDIGRAQDGSNAVNSYKAEVSSVSISNDSSYQTSSDCGVFCTDYTTYWRFDASATVDISDEVEKIKFKLDDDDIGFGDDDDGIQDTVLKDVSGYGTRTVSADLSYTEDNNDADLHSVRVQACDGEGNCFDLPDANRGDDEKDSSQIDNDPS